MLALSSQGLGSDAHQDAIWDLTQQFSVLHPLWYEPGAKKEMLRNSDCWWELLGVHQMENIFIARSHQ